MYRDVISSHGNTHEGVISFGSSIKNTDSKAEEIDLVHQRHLRLQGTVLKGCNKWNCSPTRCVPVWESLSSLHRGSWFHRAEGMAGNTAVSRPMPLHAPVISRQAGSSRSTLMLASDLPLNHSPKGRLF